VLIAAAAGGALSYGTAFALLDAAMLGVALLGVLAAHRAGARGGRAPASAGTGPGGA
jgi:hypothetical protein